MRGLPEVGPSRQVLTRARRGLVRVAVYGCSVLSMLTGCSASEGRTTDVAPNDREFAGAAQPDTAVDFSYYLLPRAQEARITFRLLGRQPLGMRADDTPATVTDMLMDRDRTIVLDGQTRRLLGYDEDGRLLFASGSWGTGPGDLDTPVALWWQGDTVAVLDLSHDDHISFYTTTGALIGSNSFPLEDGATSGVFLGSRYVFATLVSRTRGPLAYGVVAMATNGRPLWRSCQVPPTYAESDARNGAAGRYAFRSVAIANGRLMCTHPLSPTIQVFDTLGRFVGIERRAPSYYRRATDRSMTTNLKESQRFEAGWTAHKMVFARSHGFLSVYTQWDTTAGGLTYLLFLCDSLPSDPRRSHCASGRSPGQPVELAGDTLVTVTLPNRVGVRNLARFRMRVEDQPHSSSR